MLLVGGRQACPTGEEEKFIIEFIYTLHNVDEPPGGAAGAGATYLRPVSWCRNSSISRLPFFPPQILSFPLSLARFMKQDKQQVLFFFPGLVEYSIRWARFISSSMYNWSVYKYRDARQR